MPLLTFGNGGRLTSFPGEWDRAPTPAAGSSVTDRISRSLPDLSPELTYRAVTGGSPGGQHANRTATKVEVRWTPSTSARFSEGERGRLTAKLAARLTGEGELVLTDQSSRSQATNRERVTARLYDTIERALRREKRRKPTKPTKGSKRRRLEGKRRRSEVKSKRGRVRW